MEKNEQKNTGVFSKKKKQIKRKYTFIGWFALILGWISIPFLFLWIQDEMLISNNTLGQATIIATIISLVYLVLLTKYRRFFRIIAVLGFLFIVAYKTYDDVNDIQEFIANNPFIGKTYEFIIAKSEIIGSGAKEIYQLISEDNVSNSKVQEKDPQ